MDRPIVFPGELPRSFDFLSASKFAMLADSYGFKAILGSSTATNGSYFDGLGCLPTSPTADLNIHIQPGSVYASDQTDATAYGVVGTDTNVIIKQGILNSIQNFTLTNAGLTTGQSYIFLVEAALVDVDSGSQVVSYFNANNPPVPFSGPANAGTPNFTVRQAACNVQVKQGVAGSPGVAPTVDAGYIGLYTVQVSFGQTQVTSGNITQLTSAPFIPVTLPKVPAGVQAGTWLFGADTGAANAMVASVTPIPTALTLGMEIHIKAAATNTGATTLNLNGLGTVAVHRAGGAALSASDILINQVVGLIYDGSSWQIKNYLGTSGTNTNNFNNVNMPYALDTSTSSNTITISPTPAMSSTIAAGQVAIVKLANPITGATTMAVSGVTGSPFPVISFTGQPLTFGSGRTGEMLWMLYDGTSFQIINPPQPLQAALTIFVNPSTGSDTLDGSQATVSGTKGPLQHCQTAVNKAFNYPPSQFAITIQCADGTYNESIATPAIPGPALIINGNSGSPSNVIFNGANNVHAFLVQGPNTMTVQNLKSFTGTGSGPPSAFVAQGSGASIITNNTVTGGCAQSAHEAFINGSVTIGNHTYVGNMTSALLAANNGCVIFSPNAVFTISTSITVSDWVIAETGGQVEAPNPGVPTFVNPGNVTGKKFFALLGGCINTQGQGVNYFPGNSAGTNPTGYYA